jgi:nucleoside-triphosphatase THEP1
MIYSNKTNPDLKLFCEELYNYLFNEKHIVLTELQKLISHFGTTNKNSIIGTLEFKIHSKTRAENGTITTISEIVTFSSKGYLIKSFSQEDHFGEYININEFRIGEVEVEEHISSFLENALKSIMIILKDENGYFEITNNKFDLE